jgi:hypothetical protein
VVQHIAARIAVEGVVGSLYRFGDESVVTALGMAGKDAAGVAVERVVLLSTSSTQEGIVTALAVVRHIFACVTVGGRRGH